MDSENQLNLGSSGEYNPSKRAAAGMRNAKSAGAGSNPVVSDGPSSGEKSFSTPSDSKEPKPVSTPKPPAENAQHGFIQPGDVRSISDEKI